MTKTKIFEYPLNQQSRDFLRIESSLLRLEQLIQQKSRLSHHSALILLVSLLDLLTRSDIKAELIKELEIQQAHFIALASNPAVDASKLEAFLTQLKKLHQWAIHYKGRLGDTIRNQPFIDTLWKKNNLLASSVPFDLPELNCFLSLTDEKRHLYFTQWMDELNGLKTSIEVILRLTRELSRFNPAVAPIGDYLIERPDIGISLLRIKLNEQQQHFMPDVSASRHRISIHFYCLSNTLAKKKYTGEVEFQYATCGWKTPATNEKPVLSPSV